ncbi:hypothetical protein GCM10027346_37620 [Hymenobacter seoulensis]
MHLLSRIHYKARPVGLFLLVMLGVLGSSLVEKHLLRDLHTSVASLYQDRLLPATGLFQLNDLMYAKRQALERYLAAPSTERRRRTKAQLAAYNQQIAALIACHEATYLVPEEARVFDAFRACRRRYDALEAQLLATTAPGAPAQTAALARQFTRIHADLSRLNDIQRRVGQQVSRDARATEGSALLLGDLELALLVIFTLAIQCALLRDRHPLVPKSTQNFRLN